MFIPFRPKVYKSRLSLEEYEHYKSELNREIERKMAFGIGIPDIRFDDKYRHIVLMDFEGCLMGDDTIVVPDGVTLVYVTRESCESKLNLDVKYNLILADSVQYIDELPFKDIKFFDTNKLEAFRLNNTKLDNKSGRIQAVIVRDSLRQEKCIGHFKSNYIFYKLDKPYKLCGNQAFLALESYDSDVVDMVPVTKVFVDSKCSGVSLGKRLVNLYLCDGASLKVKTKRISLCKSGLDMEQELEKVLNEG